MTIQTREHSHHPGEYRPFGYDTLWCPVCDRPTNREQTPNGYCSDHLVTCEDSTHTHDSLLGARTCAAGMLWS